MAEDKKEESKTREVMTDVEKQKWGTDLTDTFKDTPKNKADVYAKRIRRDLEESSQEERHTDYNEVTQHEYSREEYLSE